MFDFSVFISSLILSNIKTLASTAIPTVKIIPAIPGNVKVASKIVRIPTRRVRLIINLILRMGVLTILGATLTLRGIAGIILTVGMAVDANVLIFERIKEEMKNEKSIIHSFDSGYQKAKTAVLDANVTTLISAAILFFLGSGPVKGFAVTLGIGILTTLFSAYFFARHLSSLYVMKNKDNEIKL